MPGYVGFWQRLAAFLIDWLVVFVVYGPLVIMAFGSEYFSLEVPRYWDAATGLVIAVGTLLFWRYQGATPGKIAIAARIVDAETRGSPSTARLVVRLFAYIVSALPLCLGFLWIAFDRRKQGWHDKIAGTVVIPDDE
ncbi:MAG TPA: RDD family protein [Burkholderiales bacterium]|nr:RDD family protein [Burkholderiales bacterium]